MIDCHFHVWTADNSTPAKRAERADQVKRNADRFGIERICLIHERGDGVAECREHNRTVARYVEEHDLFHGWARANPKWGEAGVAEFRRAVEEDGLIGLKLYAQVPLSDARLDPFAEAAVDMDVPIISHVAHRTEPSPEKPEESDSDDVRALAERFPDLNLISGHIGGGGQWEYRIENLAPVENVYLDTSGSVTAAGMLEMAADRLGTDRLLFGTDTWVFPGAGKLLGADLTPEQKAEIACNTADLVPEHAPNKLGPEQVEAVRERARERFAAYLPREEAVVDANAFVGPWPFRSVPEDADGLLAEMDRVGVDRAVVSATRAVFYRNPHRANRALAAEVEGTERLLPFATIDPTFPEWEAHLTECVEELGMRGAKLFPLHHDYAIDDPAVAECLRACAERGVPAMFVATLEDQRGRHHHVTIRDYEDVSKHFSGAHVDALVDVLTEVPETDVILANAWSAAARIHEDLTAVQEEGVRLDNAVREGRTLFVVDDLFVFFAHQADGVAEEIGPESLVCGPKLPFRNFGAHYVNAEHLPVGAADAERVRAGNLRDLL